MRRVGSLAGLACALLWLATSPARAANVLDATALFAWAQSHYSQYFPGGYYAWTDTYLAVKNGEVYVKGPVSAGQIWSVGSLASYECQVYPSNCPVTSPPPSDAVAFSGRYYGSANGTTPNVFMMVAADGSFVGTNYVATRAEVFSGMASAQAGSWSATGARYGVYTTSGPYATLGSADFTGTFANASSATASITASGVTPANTQLTLTYDPGSNTPASLWIASGLYTTPPLGQAITIDPSSGALSGTIQTNCSASGTISVPEATRNVYKAQLTLTGSSCPVTGVVDLLGFYYTTANGQQGLSLMGTTPGAQLAYITLTLYRAS
jgi:hypothetical protein